MLSFPRYRLSLQNIGTCQKRFYQLISSLLLSTFRQLMSMIGHGQVCILEVTNFFTCFFESLSSISYYSHYLSIYWSSYFQQLYTFCMICHLLLLPSKKNVAVSSISSPDFVQYWGEHLLWQVWFNLFTMPKVHYQIGNFIDKVDFSIA